jgi:uncharacterized protein YecE (DUF72 family)
MTSGTTSTGKIRIGTSGWMYDDWRGVIYPRQLPKRAWFEHYATLFDTVELNTTFYRLPAATTVERWAEMAPPGFEFALKLGAFGTHRMKLRDAASWLPNHVERASILGPALGPTVVQLPPRWKRSLERLDEFLATAPAPMRWAVELREPSWVHDDTFDVLRRHGAALVVHDLLPRHPVVLTTTWTYLRFHGPNAGERPYHGSYRGATLQRWAERIAEWSDAGYDVYAYFNNDYEGNAVRNAATLIERSRRERVGGGDRVAGG